MGQTAFYNQPFPCHEYFSGTSFADFWVKKYKNVRKF